jgi:exopolyphosphatase/pppGpp-phosphohydrolase
VKPGSENQHAPQPVRKMKSDDCRKRYAAIDLGTNSCRLLVAVPDDAGFHVTDGFSKVVRLGDRVSETGHFQQSAIHRTVAALRNCAVSNVSAYGTE